MISGRVYEISTNVGPLSSLSYLVATSGQVDKALHSYLFIFSSISITLTFADDKAEDGTFSQWDQESLVST